MSKGTDAVAHRKEPPRRRDGSGSSLVNPLPYNSTGAPSVQNRVADCHTAREVVRSLLYLLPPPGPPPVLLVEPEDCVAVLGFADDAPVPLVAPVVEGLVVPIAVPAVPVPAVPAVRAPVVPVVPVAPPVEPPLVPVPLDICAIAAPARVSAKTLARTTFPIITQSS